MKTQGDNIILFFAYVEGREFKPKIGDYVAVRLDKSKIELLHARVTTNETGVTMKDL